MPSAAFLFTYLGALAFAFVAAFFTEEFGWRGFALPCLQVKHGPLLGTLVLGALPALWHLPAWAFFPSATGAGTSSFSSTFAITMFGFACETVALAIIITWLFNHSRGSVLLAILIHAASNAAAGSFLKLFPSLFPQSSDSGCLRDRRDRCRDGDRGGNPRAPRLRRPIKPEAEASVNERCRCDHSSGGMNDDYCNI